MKKIFKALMAFVFSFIFIFGSYTIVSHYALQPIKTSLQHQAQQIKKQPARIIPTQIVSQQAKPLNQHKRQAFINGENRLRIHPTSMKNEQMTQAWREWYQEKKPPECDQWQSESHMVECVNHSIRSKREFEKFG
jgi:hypothetical protein